MVAVSTGSRLGSIVSTPSRSGFRSDLEGDEGADEFSNSLTLQRVNTIARHEVMALPGGMTSLDEGMVMPDFSDRAFVNVIMLAILCVILMLSLCMYNQHVHLVRQWSQLHPSMQTQRQLTPSVSLKNVVSELPKVGSY